MSNIYIISQPVKTGKTSLLLNWAQQQDDITGFLTPDIDKKRKLFDLSNKCYYDFELNEGEKGISIGRFVFDESVFKRARRLMEQAIELEKGWVVVDEIGRLEIDRNEGLEPSLSKLINHFNKCDTGKAKLLLVIRDYLLESAVNKYNLQSATILGRSFFETEKTPSVRPAGLVLCGGRSSRMGTDKAFITYHNKPQYQYVADMMRACFDEVFISCNRQQLPLINPSYKTIADDAQFGDNGPLTGLLSFYKANGPTPVIVCGCDYPYFNMDDLLLLNTSRKHGYDVVCYRNTASGYAEPLLALYEKQCADLLLSNFNSGNTSLRRFVEKAETLYLNTDNTHLQSVDE